MEELPAAPSFIRNIVSLRGQLKELTVPKAFVEDNPRIFHNCKSVILQVPGGREYKVDVKTKNGSIVFRGEWKDFAEHYELDLGYFLVFFYRGSSRFQVGIADTSNCEIDYTPFHCQCEPENEEDEAEEEDEEDEGEGEIDATPLNKAKERTSLAFDRAEMQGSDYPSFNVEMNASYLSNDYRLWVPINHGHRFLKTGNSNVRLKVELKKGGTTTWKVKANNGPKSARFGAGWKQFVKTNHLDAGDACKFELIDRNTQTYLVHIFRNTSTPSSPP